MNKASELNFSLDKDVHYRFLCWPSPSEKLGYLEVFSLFGHVVFQDQRGVKYGAFLIYAMGSLAV